MATKKKTTTKARGKSTSAAPPVAGSVAERTAFALEWLQKHSTPKDRDNLARFGISANNALGVSMANIQRLGKLLGKDQALACALWDTECYEARMLVSFVGEADKLTQRQMDTWCKDFDNWAICDTLCFHLFDRSALSWGRIEAWRSSKPEFSKRAAFALLASIAGHDKAAADEPFIAGLRYIEEASEDERNFVKKGVDWALRRIGSRNANLNRLALATAETLAASTNPAARWIGKTSARELGSAKARARFARTRSKPAESSPANTKLTGAKPTGNKPTGNKPTGNKPAQGKARAAKAR